MPRAASAWAGSAEWRGSDRGGAPDGRALSGRANRASSLPGTLGFVQAASWKMMPAVNRSPERSRLTPWRRFTR